MARNAKATITLDVAGRSRVRAALTGVTSDMKAAGSAQAASSRSSAAAAVRADAQRSQSAHRAAQAITREAKTAERARVGAERAVAREAEKTARTQERIAQRMQRSAARQHARMAQAQARQGQRDSAGLASGASGIAGAVGIPTSIGAGAAVMFTAMATLAKKLNDRVQAVIDAVDANSGRLEAPAAAVETINQDVAITSLAQAAFGDVGDSEFAARVDAITQKINEVAVATNTEPGALIEGLRLFQDRFSDLQFGVDSMESLARAAKVTGVSVEELVGLVGQLKNPEGMNLAAGDVEQFMALLAQQGLKGAVTPAEMARSFGTTIGQYHRQGGKTGIAGAREWGALAQTQMVGGGGAEESSTRMSEALRILSDTQTIDRLSEATGGRRGRGGRYHGGVDVRAIRAAGGGMTEILDAIHAAPQLRNAETFQQVFKDKQGREGIGIWAGQMDAIKSLTAADIGAGQSYISTGARRIAATTGEQTKNIAIRENIERGRVGAGQVAQSDAFMRQQSTMRQMGAVGDLVSQLPMQRAMYEFVTARQAEGRTDTPGGAKIRRTDAVMDAIFGDAIVPWIESLSNKMTGTSGAITKTSAKGGVTEVAGTMELGPRTIAALRADAPAPPPVVIGPGLGGRTPAQRARGERP